jgi:hypothetical protein
MSNANVKEPEVTVVEEEDVEVTEVNETAVETTAEPVKEPGKVKRFFGKAKEVTLKALPYVGAFVAGAGAAIGAAIVMTRPDGTEVELLEKDDELIPADEFIDGEAEIVETEEE